MNGPPYSALAVPEPLNEDDDDIRWALHTAAVQWRRGAREDAVAWVRRGADAAVDGGFWERASQLNAAAAHLERALTGQSGGELPVASSRPKVASRAPTQVSRSQPVSTQAHRSTPPAAPQPIKPVHLSKPPSVRVPTSGASIPNSRWPTGFPQGPPAATTPSGRAIAPPPPLPGSVRPHKAPIPPPPKSKSRDGNRDSMVDIEIGADEVELSEEESLALHDEGTVERSEHTDPSIPAMNSVPAVEAPVRSLPSYELNDEEDEMDGTTALPFDAPIISSYPPDSMQGQSLPAFPLDDSSPAGAPTVPPEPPPPMRHNPPPQFGSVKPGDGPRSRSLPAVPQRTLGTRDLARWASRDEPKEITRRVPSQMSPRPTPSAPSPSESVRAARRGVSLPAETSRKPSRAPSTRPPPSAQGDDTLLEPIGLLPHDEVLAESFLHDEEREATKISEQDPLISAIDAVPAEEPGQPPSTARGLGQLGSGPPDGPPDDDDDELLRASVPTEAPPARSRTMPSNGSPTSAVPPVLESLGSLPLPALTISEMPSSRPIAEVPPALIEPELQPLAGAAEVPLSSRQSELVESTPPGELLEGPVSNPIPSIHGIILSEVRGLCDLPEDAQRMLRQRARIERMGTGEDLSFFAVVLVLEGWVKLMPAIADITCATASAGDVVFTQGTLQDGVALRVTSGQNGTTLATWDKATFNEITETCPWVADELRLIADSFQALAGTTLGALGERLDDSLREVVTSRCRVLTLMPHEVLVCAGKPVPGMHIVGAGVVELLDAQGNIVGTGAPGDFLLAAQVMAGGMSPHTARAASGGALVLFAPRMVAHELLVSVPPLLEILAG